MNNQRIPSSAAAGPQSPPSFDPVPIRARHDGWTTGRQVRFIAALAASKSVQAAANAVGMRRETAYRLRRRPGAASFAAAWDKIMEQRSAGFTDPSVAWRRGFFGVVDPIVHGGRLVGLKHRYDNEALLKLLRRYDRAVLNMGRWAEPDDRAEPDERSQREKTRCGLNL